MRLQYENKVINGVQVLRRAADSTRHWVCKCPLCHDEFRARTDTLTNGTVKNCGKHSKAHHARIVREAERKRVQSMLRTEDVDPADDDGYGVFQAIDARGNVVKRPLTREEREAKRRKKQDDTFRKMVLPDSLLTPVERLPDQRGHQRWLFACACGARVYALRSNVVSGRTRSCGCIGKGRPKGSTTTNKTVGTPAVSVPKAFLDLWK